MLHLRLVLPDDSADLMIGQLATDARVTNVVVLPGAARNPAGTAVMCDVAREAASDVLERLRAAGLDERGSVSLHAIDASPSANAWAAERAAAGSPDDAVVWDIVRERAQADATRSWSFFAFLTLATCIAAVAVVLDSAILVVGAMVIGPEFNAIIAVAVGLVIGPRVLSARGAGLLIQGFAVAIAITALLGVLGGAVGWISAGDLTAPRPLTGFIWEPDRWSFVVSLLAGCAGALSHTSSRSSNALVGVFISVTTVPAAGNLALALALGVSEEIAGALAQLSINLAGLVIAASLTLLMQRTLLRVERPTTPTRST